MYPIALRLPSGLVHALRVLSHIEGIATVHFTDSDVVRHPLVSAIVRAYESASEQGDHG